MHVGSNVGWQTLQKKAQRLGAYDTTTCTGIQDGLSHGVLSGLQGTHRRHDLDIFNPGRCFMTGCSHGCLVIMDMTPAGAGGLGFRELGMFWSILCTACPNLFWGLFHGVWTDMKQSCTHRSGSATDRSQKRSPCHRQAGLSPWWIQPNWLLQLTMKELS